MSREGDTKMSVEVLTDSPLWHQPEPPIDDECLTCTEDPEGTEYPKGECPGGRRPCGHHCNCSWIHDHCHWCNAEFGEDA